jgi:D-threo-aldose 1-dehydrogenase
MEKATKLKAIADEFAIPLGAAALQFPQAHDIISSVIPGPRSEDELVEILAWQRTKIASEFWVRLKDERLLMHEAPVPN